MKTESQAYAGAKRATLKEIRALKLGDVIECYYADCEDPVLEVVVATTESSKVGNDIRTIPLDHFRARGRDCYLNTDKFKHVGRIEQSAWTPL